MKTEIKRRADHNIKKLVTYISEKGYPETAERYTLRLYSFLFSLAEHPEVYTPCKNKKWAIRGYRCAVFEGAYVVPFKIKGNTVYIMNVMHGSKLK